MDKLTTTQPEQEPTPSAFPSSLFTTDKGMSLRDWFAGKIIQGYLAGYNPEEDGPIWPDPSQRLAEEAYEQADMMLAARAEAPNPFPALNVAEAQLVLATLNQVYIQLSKIRHQTVGTLEWTQEQDDKWDLLRRALDKLNS